MGRITFNTDTNAKAGFNFFHSDDLNYFREFSPTGEKGEFSKGFCNGMIDKSGLNAEIPSAA